MIYKPTNTEHIAQPKDNSNKECASRGHRCHICGANYATKEELAGHESKHLIVSSHVR